MNRRVSWSGSFVVAVTPFGRDGSFDEPAIRKLVECLITEGADGLVMAGSTGEWYTLTDAERIRLFQVTVHQTKGRAKVLAGTSAIATSDAVALTLAAKDAGCDGVMLLPPPYVLPTERELIAYFSAVDEVGLPIMLYNNPTRTGVNLDARLLGKLLALKNIAALKDSVKDLSQLSATLRAYRDEIAVFVGFEGYVIPLVQRGAVGMVGMSPNVLGRTGMDLFRHAARGEWKDAAALIEKIDLLYDQMYGSGQNPYVVVKDAMRLLGRPGGWPRPPLLPLADADRETLRRFLIDFGALTGAEAAE